MFHDQNLVSENKPAASLLVIFLTVLIGFLVMGPLIGIIITDAFYPGDLLGELDTPQVDLFPYLLLLQGIVSFVGLIVFPLLLLKAVERKPLRPFFKPERQWWFVLLILSMIGFTFIVTISPIVEWNAKTSLPEFMKGFEELARSAESRAAELTKVLTTFDTLTDMLLGLLVIGILPAVGEELVFRGMIQNEFWRWTKNPHWAIWISAALFSAIHLQFFGFVPRLLLGALFGYLYYWSGNLIVPMFAHFFNNGLSVVSIYLHKNEFTTMNLEETEAASWPMVIISTVLCFGLLYYFRHFYKTRLSSIQ